VVLSGSKATAMYMQRKKPMLLRWTLAWRRNHKKLNVEIGQKRKTRKVVRTVTRNFVGMTSDEVRSVARVRWGSSARVLLARPSWPLTRVAPRARPLLPAPAAQGKDEEDRGPQARAGGGRREGQGCAARGC